MRTHGSGSFWESGNSLYYKIWVDGVRHGFRLGKLTDFPTQKSRDAAAREVLAKLPTTSPRDVRNVTLAEFTERTYLPWAREAVRRSVYNEYKGMYERHVKALAAKPLRHYGTPQAQDLLDSIAEDNAGRMSKATMKHIRALCSGIFKHAKKRGLYYGENPMHDCTLPSGLKPPRSTSAYTLPVVNAVLDELKDNLEARAIVAVCAFAGLRRSEVQGLRWCDWEGDQLHVRQSVFNYVVNEPKSAASKNWVPVIPQLKEALEAHRAELVKQDEFGIRTGSDCRMFLYTLEHIGKKKIAAAFRRAGYRFEGYHGFRRGIASNLFELGASDLLVMRILRHASVQVTRASYIKVRDNLLESAMAELSDAAKRSENGPKNGLQSG
ncbi:MAG: tyrosine-type recombinase/integrase [Acidobacteriia bacterium]|nr:tyrosine-type recombinase/integrase [Terriglobia bacterium]